MKTLGLDLSTTADVTVRALCKIEAGQMVVLGVHVVTELEPPYPDISQMLEDLNQ